LIPTDQEITDNPRARSAKLRVAEANSINDILASGETQDELSEQVGEQDDD